LAKEVVVKVRVPDWVDEKRVEERVLRLAEEIVAAGEQSADEARGFFGVDETVEEIEVPKNLPELLRASRKRVW